MDTIKATILDELRTSVFSKSMDYLSDGDTYIRKAAYQSIGLIYFENDVLQQKNHLLVGDFVGAG